MKISYVLQLKDLSIMLLFGFLLGIIYGILNIPNTIKKRISRGRKIISKKLMERGGDCHERYERPTRNC